MPVSRNLEKAASSSFASDDDVLTRFWVTQPIECNVAFKPQFSFADVPISQGLVPITPESGFSMDFRAAASDEVAREAALKVFGNARVNHALKQFHRATLTLCDLKADLLEYSRIHKRKFSNPVLDCVIESARQDIVPPAPLIPWTLKAVTTMPDLPRSRSAGLYFREKYGYTRKGDALEDARVITDIRDFWHRVSYSGDFTMPDCAAYARAQICDVSKNKVRATWGYDLLVYAEEARFFYPLLEHLKKMDRPCIGYQLEMARGGMQWIDQMVSGHRGKVYFMADWSKFDKTIPSWLIRKAFDILFEFYDFSAVKDSSAGYHGRLRTKRQIRRWQTMVNYFINTPVKLASGERYLKQGGVPSGSCFTNVIDSIVNLIVVRYCIYQVTGSFPIDDIYFGDDSVVVLEDGLDIEAFAHVAQTQFGMILNRDKSYTTRRADNVYFLGYYNQRGHPAKPVDSLLASAILPERTVHSRVETVARLVGQAYACFDPSDATKFFFMAQHVLAQTHATRTDIITWIQEHPYKFKYLRLYGVDSKHISFPHVGHGSYVMCTMPTTPRLVYFRRYRDWSAIHGSAYIRSLRDSDDDQEVPLDDPGPDDLPYL